MKNYIYFVICFGFIFIAPRVQAQLVEAQEVWTAFYDNQKGTDYVYDMTVDAGGNTYVTGPSNQDITTIKYDPSGNRLWAARFQNAEVHSIEVDGSGNVYVTGMVNIIDGGFVVNRNCITIKYNSSGVEQWSAMYDGGGSSYEYGNDIAVDGSGNVYVAGMANLTGSNDFLAIKYNSSGAQQWASTYDGPGPDNYNDVANAVAVDASGNVYAAGITPGTSGFPDAVTIKYNSSGQIQWTSLYSSPNNYSDYLLKLVLDSYGYVYVGGYIDGPSSADNSDFLTIKYNPSTGNQEWLSRYDGGFQYDDVASDLLIDASNNIYIGGDSYDGVNNIAVVKYNSSGAIQWVAKGSTEYLGGINMALDVPGNVYVTGQYTGGKNDLTTWTARFNSSGKLVWTKTYTTPSNRTFSFVATDNSGNVIVSTSGIVNDSTWYDFITIKYEQVHLSVDNAVNDVIAGVNALPLSSGNKNALISKLQNAIQKYDSRDLLAAKNLLNAFINQLNQFVLGGYITAQQAQPLLDYAYLIIGEINSLLAKGENAQLPGQFSLYQNYPNPFNPSTTISYDVPLQGDIEILVYNSLGEKVADLIHENKEPGHYEVQWNAASVSSGIYFCRMRARDFISLQKMILMK